MSVSVSVSDKDDIYGTHRPVLRELGRVVNPRTVVEFGAGLYSTGMFLDRDVFPALTRLVSFESDDKWADIMRGLYFGRDDRFDLRRMSEAEMVLEAAIVVPNAGLIFIDSATAEGRVRLIETVAQLRPHCPVVVHDAENHNYQRALAGFPYIGCTRRWTPWTAVARFWPLPDLDWASLDPVLWRFPAEQRVP